MRRIHLAALLSALGVLLASEARPERLVWPPAPDRPRVEYVGEIRLSELHLQTGFFQKLGRLLGGKSDDETIAHPFDVTAVGNRLYLVCQNVSALVEVDLEDEAYRLLRCEETPLSQPVAVCRYRNGVLVSDSANGMVYRYDGDELRPWLTDDLVRPTGLAAVSAEDRVYVVDTGDHALKVFDDSGRWIDTYGGRAESVEGLNYPTFVAATGTGELLVNDTMNYRVKRYHADGTVISTFGVEGNGPGAFARPKGVAVDDHGNVYVVDALFDNVQIFDPQGRVLLVIGTGGGAPGQFWSPAGIDIVDDRIYVADTFNDRLQLFRYLGGEG